jgi:hypothetical protein
MDTVNMPDDEMRSTMIFDNECILRDNHDRTILEVVAGNSLRCLTALPILPNLHGIS